MGHKGLKGKVKWEVVRHKRRHGWDGPGRQGAASEAWARGRAGGEASAEPSRELRDGGQCRGACHGEFAKETLSPDYPPAPACISTPVAARGWAPGVWALELLHLSCERHAARAGHEAQLLAHLRVCACVHVRVCVSLQQVTARSRERPIPSRRWRARSRPSHGAWKQVWRLPPALMAPRVFTLVGCAGPRPDTLPRAACRGRCKSPREPPSRVD